jgi:hypothetical protein
MGALLVLVYQVAVVGFLGWFCVHHLVLLVVKLPVEGDLEHLDMPQRAEPRSK